MVCRKKEENTVLTGREWTILIEIELWKIKNDLKKERREEKRNMKRMKNIK